MTTDPRDLCPIEIADVLREHLDDEWIPYVDEMERAWVQLWAREMIGKIADE